MKRNRRLSLILLVFLAFSPVLSVRAEIPDDVLQKDYDSCLGGDKDPDRAAYCQCVMNGMKGWSEDQYSTAAQEAQEAASKGPNTPPPSILTSLAKGCLTKVLHD